jgi:CRISPR-associated protein Cas2
MAMNILVAYDVNTTTPAGRRRLRRVARVCLDFGQRVQYSLFECAVGETELATLRTRLLSEIDTAADSLRLYRLNGGFGDMVEAHGRNRAVDFQAPLIV